MCRFSRLKNHAKFVLHFFSIVSRKQYHDSFVIWGMICLIEWTLINMKKISGSMLTKHGRKSYWWFSLIKGLVIQISDSNKPVKITQHYTRLSKQEHILPCKVCFEVWRGNPALWCDVLIALYFNNASFLLHFTFFRKM